MFSTIPMIGIPVFLQNVTSFLTSSIATDWGVVTIIAPEFNPLKNNNISDYRIIIVNNI